MSITRTAVSAARVATDARLRGATVGVVEGRAEKRALLAAIGRALRFPSYYGVNLDALEECLRDLSWLPAGEVVLVWDGSEALRAADPMAHRGLLEVLAAATEQTAAGDRPVRAMLTGVSERLAPE